MAKTDAEREVLEAVLAWWGQREEFRRTANDLKIRTLEWSKLEATVVAFEVAAKALVDERKSVTV